MKLLERNLIDSITVVFKRYTIHKVISRNRTFNKKNNEIHDSTQILRFRVMTKRIPTQSKLYVASGHANISREKLRLLLFERILKRHRFSFSLL